jgi:hypothetical protein
MAFRACGGRLIHIIRIRKKIRAGNGLPGGLRGPARAFVGSLPAGGRGGCTAEGLVVEDVLKELEQRRIETIVGLVEAGKQPPIPRKPLTSSDPLWAIRDPGLSARIAALLENATKQIR